MGFIVILSVVMMAWSMGIALPMPHLTGESGLNTTVGGPGGSGGSGGPGASPVDIIFPTNLHFFGNFGARFDEAYNAYNARWASLFSKLYPPPPPPPPPQ